MLLQESDKLFGCLGRKDTITIPAIIPPQQLTMMHTDRRKFVPTVVKLKRRVAGTTTMHSTRCIMRPDAGNQICDDSSVGAAK